MAAGRRVAELHIALAGNAELPEFAPEPITREDTMRWIGDMLASVVRGGRGPWIALVAGLALVVRIGLLTANAVVEGGDAPVYYRVAHSLLEHQNLTGNDFRTPGYPIAIVPALPFGRWLQRAFLAVTRTPQFPSERLKEVEDLLGGPNAWMNVYGLMSVSKLRFFSRPMLDNLLCPFGEPRPPLWFVYPSHVFLKHQGDERLPQAICACGAYGEPDPPTWWRHGLFL